MPTNFTHKILNAEIQPPESAWDKIAAELDKIDSNHFVNRLQAASIDPPADVWNNVAAALENPRQARKFRLNAPWMKWTAAAVVAGLLIISAIKFLDFGKTAGGTSGQETAMNKENTKTPSLNPNNSSPGTTAAVSPTTILADNNTRPTHKRSMVNTRKSQGLPVRHAQIETTEIENANEQKTGNESKVNNNVSSSATNLIPAPDYYVVTAPNGERVRISSKFSDAVTSLIGGDNVDYFWKSRFDSWKSKLMTNPSFIPSAGNFLDIAELKDLLKEQ